LLKSSFPPFFTFLKHVGQSGQAPKQAKARQHCDAPIPFTRHEGHYRMGRDFPEMKIRAFKPLNRGKTSNVQHRTPNAEMSEDSRCHSMFGVGCSMLGSSVEVLLSNTAVFCHNRIEWKTLSDHFIPLFLQDTSWPPSMELTIELR